MIVCKNCKSEVWWSTPRPEDDCSECGLPIGTVPPEVAKKWPEDFQGFGIVIKW